MNKEREKAIEQLFRRYKTNKRELAQDYNIPTPSGIAYDKIKVQADNSRNAQYEQTVEYISKREELFKRVFIVEEVLNWFRLEGHGREHFIKTFLIDGNTWVKTEMGCCLSRDTIARWRREVLEKAEIVGKWVNYF
jgi:hypothetical protein